MKTVVKPENLKTPNWRTTHILRPDLTGLMESIKTFGILSAIFLAKVPLPDAAFPSMAIIIFLFIYN